MNVGMHSRERAADDAWRHVATSSRSQHMRTPLQCTLVLWQSRSANYHSPRPARDCGSSVLPLQLQPRLGHVDGERGCVYTGEAVGTEHASGSERQG